LPASARVPSWRCCTICWRRWRGLGQSGDIHEHPLLLRRTVTVAAEGQIERAGEADVAEQQELVAVLRDRRDRGHRPDPPWVQQRRELGQPAAASNIQS
jgi:hypothetical protein